MDIIITALQSFAHWEVLAVICAATYLLLAVKEIVWCWLFAFIATLIYTALFWNVSLLMDSALNVYYMAMAVFGWYQWTRGGSRVGDSATDGREVGAGRVGAEEVGSATFDRIDEPSENRSGATANSGNNEPSTLPVRNLSARQHLWIITAIVVLSALSGYYLSEKTTAAWPYVDSFTTWASVITTYLVTQKYLQNWLYWIVIDLVSIPLYLDRELSLTALLFVFYVVIAVFGYFKWKQHFNGQMINVAS